MSLTTDAYRLLEILNHIVDCLDRYAFQNKNRYIYRLADEIRGPASAYHKAISVEKSRELAQQLLSKLTEPMEKVDGAATKGEMAIFSENDNSLNEYWRLYTIFRETSYKDQLLEPLSS